VHACQLSILDCGSRFCLLEIFKRCLASSTLSHLLADMNIAQATKLRVDWKTGVAATDWNAVAKKEHLDQLSVELRKLEDSIREVYTDMLMLQQREQEMRDISGELV